MQLYLEAQYRRNHNFWHENSEFFLPLYIIPFMHIIYNFGFLLMGTQS